jgi:hypothetical protein
MGRNEPPLILTMPYTDYVRAKGALFVLVWSFRLSVFLFPFWWIGVAIVSSVPKPVIDSWLGKTPEEIRIEARNEASIKFHDKLVKKEKEQERLIFKNRQAKYHEQMLREEAQWMKDHHY